MADRPVRLTESAARRVLRATLRVERSTDLTGEDSDRGRRPKETILARVTDVDAPFISWEEVYLEDDGETWTAKDPARIGTHDGDSPGVLLPGATAVVDQIVVLKRCPLSDGGDPATWVPGWVVVSGGGGLRWGIAIDNWTNDVGNTSWVTINPCDDMEGANPDTGTEIVVYLPRPRSAGADPARDPAVREDDVIGYMMDPNGLAICVTDCTDDPINTIKAWCGLVTDIPAGWALCDGTSGTKDLRGRFIVGYDTGDGDYNAIGDVGGSKTHTHVVDDHVLTITPTSIPIGGGAPAAAICSITPATLTHNVATADGRPPFFTLAYIQRTN